MGIKFSKQDKILLKNFKWKIVKQYGIPFCNVYGLSEKGQNVQNLEFPDCVNRIYDSVFRQNKNIRTIIFGEDLRDIGLCAFKDCENLVAVDFESCKRLDDIDAMAFANTNLSEVRLPKTTSFIGPDAFKNVGAKNGSKVKIYVPTLCRYTFAPTEFNPEQASAFDENCEIIPYMDEIGEPPTIVIPRKYVVQQKPQKPPKPQKTQKPAKVKKPRALEGKYSYVPDPNRPGFYIISGTYWAKNSCPKKIVIPSCVSEIRRGDWWIFETVVIGPNVTKIDEKAFVGSRKLTSVDFSKAKKLTQIGKSAFEKTKIQSVDLPANVTEIEDSAFAECENLHTVKAKGLQKIGSSAFSHSNVETAEFSKNLTIIDEAAFNDCYKLRSINLADLTNLKTIGEGAFYDTKLDNIEIPSSVENLGSYAFSNCGKITSFSLKANSPITQINEGTFWRCNNLKTIDLSAAKNLTSIGKYAFKFNESLEKIILPSTNISVNSKAFGDDIAFNIANTNPPTLVGDIAKIKRGEDAKRAEMHRIEEENRRNAQLETAAKERRKTEEANKAKANDYIRLGNDYFYGSNGSEIDYRKALYYFEQAHALHPQYLDVPPMIAKAKAQVAELDEFEKQYKKLIAQSTISSVSATLPSASKSTTSGARQVSTSASTTASQNINGYRDTFVPTTKEEQKQRNGYLDTKARAENGERNQFTYLGNNYYKGVGCTQSYPMAIYWYRKAVESKSTMYELAAKKLAQHYYAGDVVEKNLLEARKYYQIIYDNWVVDKNEAKMMIDKINQELEGSGINSSQSPLDGKEKHDIKSIFQEFEKKVKNFASGTHLYIECSYETAPVVEKYPTCNSYIPYVTFTVDFFNCSNSDFYSIAKADTTFNQQQFSNSLRGTDLTDDFIREFDTKDKDWSEQTRKDMELWKTRQSMAATADKVHSEINAKTYYKQKVSQEIKMIWDFNTLGKRVIVGEGKVETPTGNKVFHRNDTTKVECLINNYKVKCRFHY